MARTRVDVQIAAVFRNSLSRKRLREVVKRVLDCEGVTGQVTLVVADDEQVRALNRDFLGKDAPTDVLSFSAQEETGAFVSAPEMADYLGDVIVSYPQAVEQAMAHGHSVEKELDLLIVHGVLHLLGYDHADEQEKATMWARQDAIMKTLHQEEA